MRPSLETRIVRTLMDIDDVGMTSVDGKANMIADDVRSYLAAYPSDRPRRFYHTVTVPWPLLASTLNEKERAGFDHVFTRVSGQSAMALLVRVCRTDEEYVGLIATVAATSKADEPKLDAIRHESGAVLRKGSRS